jgi:DNA-binding LacI/PurR family transcriptional regulator
MSAPDILGDIVMTPRKPVSSYKYEQLQQRLEVLLAGLPPETPLPTVRALMREFRVSQITVTRVLDNLEQRGLVIREPRRRLLSGNGRKMLAMKEPLRIALVIPVASSNLGRRLIQVLESKLGNAGTITVFESRYSLEKETELIRNLGETFSGLIIRPAFDHIKCTVNPNLEAELRANLCCPYVQILSPWFGCGHPGIGFSSHAAMLAATDLLLDRGVRRIACIPYFESLEDIETFNGIQAAFNHLNGAAELSLQHLGRTNERKEQEVLALLKSRPDAVIVTYPPFIYFLEKAIVASGLRVPEDLLVVSVLEDNYMEYIRIPVIAVRQPTACMAERALAVLLAKIRFEPMQPELPLAAELVIDPQIQAYFAESGGGLLKKFRSEKINP